MKKTLITITSLLLFAVMLSGCSGKNAQTQDELKELSIAALEDGKYEEALSGFDEALSYAGGRVTPREIDICYYKAVTQYLMEDTAGACDTLDSVIKYDKKNADAYYLRGSIYLSEGESDLAVADYKSSIAKAPGDYERVIRVFYDLESENMRDAGLAIVSEALSSMEDSDDTLLWRGRLFILLEQYDKAMDVFTKAQGAGMTEADVYLAQVLVEQEEFDGAADKLTDYLASDAVTPEGLATAGEQYMKMEQYESAYDCFEKGISYYNAPEDEKKEVSLDVETYRRLLNDRVAACEFLGEWEDALAYAREYILDYPQDEHMLREIKFLASR